MRGGGANEAHGGGLALARRLRGGGGWRYRGARGAGAHEAHGGGFGANESHGGGGVGANAAHWGGGGGWR